jgi:hypothetical protein
MNSLGVHVCVCVHACVHKSVCASPCLPISGAQPLLQDHPFPAGDLPVVARIQAGHCSRCVELPMQLAGALAEGPAASVVQEEATGAAAAGGAGAYALHPWVLC